MAAADSEQVVAVTETGHLVGPVPRTAAHQLPGTLHLAVSVQLFDAAARCLLQQRAASKALFPGRWANTCCGHPRPGESLIRAAARRLEEELGLVDADLRPAGTFVYYAVDGERGTAEHELDHVFVGRVSGDPAPVDSEVADVLFASHDEALALLHSSAGAPWAPFVLDLAWASDVRPGAQQKG